MKDNDDGLVQRLHGNLQTRQPAFVLVLATTLIAGGALVVVFPGLIAWIVGLGLVLGGVAALGTLLDRPGRR